MKKSSFLIGAVIGGLAGAVAAALTTPKTGEELRKDIKTESEKAYSDAKVKMADLSETGKGKIDGMLSDEHKEKIDEVKSKISGLTEGGAQRFNEELDKLKENYGSSSDKFQQEYNKLRDKYLSK